MEIALLSFNSPTRSKERQSLETRILPPTIPRGAHLYRRAHKVLSDPKC